MYADARERVIDLVSGADPSLLDQTVPATPAWTGRQLFAHMVGIPSDVLAGRLDGVGTDAWGQRQVDERSDRSVEELADEWRSSAAAFDGMVAGGPEGMTGALGADVIQHELDLRALVGAGVPDGCAAGVEAFLNFMVGFLDKRVKKASLPALRLRAGNQDWTVGSGDVAATLTASPIELFRVVAGRRSERQVRALDWQGDPDPYLGVLSAFGPLSADDVVEPF